MAHEQHAYTPGCNILSHGPRWSRGVDASSFLEEICDDAARVQVDHILVADPNCEPVRCDGEHAARTPREAM